MAVSRFYWHKGDKIRRKSYSVFGYISFVGNVFWWTDILLEKCLAFVPTSCWLGHPKKVEIGGNKILNCERVVM